MPCLIACFTAGTTALPSFRLDGVYVPCGLRCHVPVADVESHLLRVALAGDAEAAAATRLRPDHVAAIQPDAAPLEQAALVGAAGVDDDDRRRGVAAT